MSTVTTPPTAAPTGRPAPVGRTATATAARARQTRARRERRAAYLFLAPDLLGLLVFVALPMVLSFVLSLFQVSGFGQYDFVGLGNYRRMFGDPEFFSSLRTTGVYLLVLVPLGFAVSLGLALLVRQPLPGVGVFRTLYFLPYAVSIVVVALVWRFMLDDQTGVVNKALVAVGLPAQSWLGDPSLALGTAIVITVWVQMGYYMVILLGGMQEIPRDYYESATIDGAGALSTFAHITWPLLKPTSFFVLMTSTIAAVTGAFDLIFVLTKGGPANSTSVLIFYIYQQAFVFGEYGYAAAMGTFLVLVLLLVSVSLLAVTRGGRFSYDD